jgi:hypothetical protein
MVEVIADITLLSGLHFAENKPLYIVVNEQRAPIDFRLADAAFVHEGVKFRAPEAGQRQRVGYGDS